MADRTLLGKLAGIETRYEELERMIADPDNVSDYEKVSEYAQERAEIQHLVDLTRQYRAALDELEQAEALLDDPDMADLAREESARLEDTIPDMEDRLRRMLLPKDKRDSKSVIMEIRAGAGGDEAGIFAADLFRMYSRYAEEHRWKTEILSAHDTGVGGYKEIIFAVNGKGAYSRLKFESGVHRVQRIPVTESQGRIHTSAVSVAVLPEAEEVEVNIKPEDLRVDVFRSSGPGGQSVNTTDSAVRLTHVPTGLVVSCQDEKSQHKNKAKAMRVLAARLYDLQRREADAERDAERKLMVGSGDRSERIRTYNFPQNRLTDHRVGLTLYSLDRVMEGELEEIIEALAIHDREERLAKSGA
jgi:peptide chain release factor 1